MNFPSESFGTRPVPMTPKASQPSASIRLSIKRSFSTQNKNERDFMSTRSNNGFQSVSNNEMTTPPSKLRRHHDGQTPPPIFSPNTIQLRSTQRSVQSRRLPMRYHAYSRTAFAENNRIQPALPQSGTPPSRFRSSGRIFARSSARRALFPRQSRESFTFYHCHLTQVNLKHINEKPYLRMIPSLTSYHILEEPVAVIFEENFQSWYVADRRLGLVIINRDMTKREFVLSSPEFENITALVVLDFGATIGFLCSAGIATFDTATMLARILYPTEQIVQGNHISYRLRGLAVTSKNEFVTIDHKLHRIAFINQTTRQINWVPYFPPQSTNYEGEFSSPTYIAVSEKQITIVDYTLASFTILRYDPTDSMKITSQTVDTTGAYPQCRLSAPFVDVSGRTLICNKKEHTMMLYDHDGRYLNTVYVAGGFCRAQSFWINDAHQVGVIDKTVRPHRLRMYALKPDNDFKQRMTEMRLTDEAIYRKMASRIVDVSPSQYNGVTYPLLSPPARIPSLMEVTPYNGINPSLMSLAPLHFPTSSGMLNYNDTTRQFGHSSQAGNINSRYSDNINVETAEYSEAGEPSSSSRILRILPSPSTADLNVRIGLENLRLN